MSSTSTWLRHHNLVCGVSEWTRIVLIDDHGWTAHLIAKHLRPIPAGICAECGQHHALRYSEAAVRQAATMLPPTWEHVSGVTIRRRTKAGAA